MSTTTLITSKDDKGRHAVGLFEVAYNKAKLDGDRAQMLNERGGEFQAWIIKGIRRFSVKQPDYALVQSILGADFITPEEVAKTRPGIVYTDEQIALLAETIPSAENFRWCKDNGYAVVPAPPSDLSLLEILEIKEADFCLKTGGWYADQEFARKDKTSFGWLAIRKTPVPNSTNKNWNDWDEQNKLLSALEHVPNIAEMSWFITMYSAVRGVRLFPNVCVRTSSLDSCRYPVYVGCFGGGELDVFDLCGGRRYVPLGLASARKFPTAQQS